MKPPCYGISRSHRFPRAARPATLLAFLLLAPVPARALVPPEPTRFDELVRPHAWIREQQVVLESGDATEPGLAVESFRRRVGGSWETSLDRRTGRALLFQGSGIPMVPGAGNSLKVSDLEAGVLDPGGKATLEGIEKLARRFFLEHGALFLPERGTLALNPHRSAVLDEGRIVYADFDWLVDGVIVEGARVFARINNGNLIQAGTRLIGRCDSTTTPSLKASDAVQRALAHAGLGGASEDVLNPGRLILLPVADQPGSYEGAIGLGVHYRLAWEVAFREAGEAPTWTARIDALTGEVLEFYDSNHYFSQITGGVFARTVNESEVVWPFPVANILSGGNTVPSDINGRAPVAPSGAAYSNLDGKYFDTVCQGCINPAQPAVSTSQGIGLLRLGTGGFDANGNGTSTRADRMTFYHLNLSRLVAKKWLNSSWLETLSFPSNVNINNSCNAFYNGVSVNFYRSGGGCNNTGEVADVIYHEWGHGLDLNTAGGDGATGEATADTVSVHITHSPLVGPYFRSNGSPVRNLDKNTTSKGLLTVSNVASKCPPGSGPLGRQVHCEGEIYGQTTWDLANALVAKWGNNTGWRTSERIFHLALPQSVTYLPSMGGSIYDAYIAVDDDDGNVANGTPNGLEIFTAFSTHEIAGVLRNSSPHCARPAEPAVTATPGCGQIGLSWQAIPGATSYRVQKNWMPGSSVFLNVATVAAPATSYVDSDVTMGLSYRYVVQAVNASGCESLINNEVIATPAAQPRLDIQSVVVDDTPVGNRSGTIDPGESVDLTLSLVNVGSIAADGISGVLTTTTQGVSVTRAEAAYQSLWPGISTPSESAYRIAVGSSVPCGTAIDLTLATTAAGSCPLETGGMRLTVGLRTPVRVDETFETSTGWTHDAANSTTTAGAWVRGDPNPTNYQPGDDVTPSGVNCWYTGTNSVGNDEVNDVDNGQVTLLSPAMDLSGLPTARLSYWRWFGQRDLGDDPSGDFFILEVSNNGGSSWVQMERLGDDVNAAVWTERVFAVESFVPLTSNMKFRVRVSDGPADPDIIEGAIDDFRITGVQCDLTPPCTAPALFSGVQSAVPGASCGETFISWQAASSQCQNAAITYSVYRSVSSSFTPSPANRVVSGLTGLSYRDSGLVGGVTYYYIVRAVDSRSGEESNAVTRSAVATIGSDLEAPVFAGIDQASSGASCGETVISWPAAQDCTAPLQYLVYRSPLPGFTPGPSNLVAETTATTYVDAALQPNTAYTYIVRARDGAGNQEFNSARLTVLAKVTPGRLHFHDFEAGPSGFSLGIPNSATEGVWELGDPEATQAQPEDDTTPPPGVNCWVTGLAAGASADSNDVGGGATTLLSPVYSLAGVSDAVVRYQRWYSNDLGANPGTYTLLAQVSNDGGASWNEFDSTTSPTPGWQLREIPVESRIPVTSAMRFQFIAQNQPWADSLVEAAIDDFEIIAPTGGCASCPPQAPVGRILLDKSGTGVRLSWAADPVSAARYVVYRVRGAAFNEPTRIGTTEEKSFTHDGALLLPESIYYYVSAVNSCGAESAYNALP